MLSLDSRYVNLTALLQWRDLQDVRKLVEFGIVTETMGIPVYRYDPETRALWVHLAAVSAVCSALGVRFPARTIKSLRQYSMTQHPKPRSSAEAATEARNQFNIVQSRMLRLATVKGNPWIPRALIDTKRELFRLDVILNVLEMETF
jgi:hypothetical protein